MREQSGSGLRQGIRQVIQGGLLTYKGSQLLSDEMSGGGGWQKKGEVTYEHP